MEEQAFLAESGGFFREFESVEGFGEVVSKKERLGEEELHLGHQFGIGESFEQFGQGGGGLFVFFAIKVG